MASFQDARHYLSELPVQLNEYLDEAQSQALVELLAALDQFFNIVTSIDIQANEDHIISSSEASDIGEHGFVLLLKLIDLLDQLDLPHKRREVEQVSLIFARWVIRYHGQIRQLQPIVNACAQLSNILQDKKTLRVLYELMTRVADSCSIEIKQDLEAGDQYRPWRLLLINRSIIATRTHDLDVMKTAFDELLTNLPQEADVFFAEGMKEMEALNYPSHVRTLMAFYYSQKTSVSMH